MSKTKINAQGVNPGDPMKPRKKHYALRQSTRLQTACGVELRNAATIDSVKETKPEHKLEVISRVTCQLCLRALLK